MTSSPTLCGVNLGGWLLVEQWMTPSIFAGTSAVDEYTLSRSKDGPARIKHHRDTFIVEQDFAWLVSHGMTAVRIPVGFWSICDSPPLVFGGKWLDWAFDMADKYDLRVIIDLHGAPGSQNGDDHSGRKGKIGWYTAKHKQQTKQALEALGARYGERRSLWGIELLNEPRAETWRHRQALKQWSRQLVKDFSGRYPALQMVYSTASFRPEYWNGQVPGVFDVHHYQCFSDEDKQLTIQGHLQKVANTQAAIATWQQTQPVIVGEWSLGLDGDFSKQDMIRYADAQLAAFSQTAGWFFWSYKTETNTDWNFRYLVENGYFVGLTDQK